MTIYRRLNKMPQGKLSDVYLGFFTLVIIDSSEADLKGAINKNLKGYRASYPFRHLDMFNKRLVTRSSIFFMICEIGLVALVYNNCDSV